MNFGREWIPPDRQSPRDLGSAAAESNTESEGEAKRVHDVWHLRSVDWLSELPAEDLERLRSISSYRDYRPGEVIFQPDRTPHSVYLLERGLVRIYRLSRDGAETTFGYVASGEVFGELAAFGDYARESFAAAVRDSRVWKIQAVPFRKLLAERTQLAIEVTRQIGVRFKRIESRLEDLVFRDVRSRLAHILVELGEALGEHRDGDLVIGEELTQSEMATLIGSTRQTVNATLRDFETQGVVGRRGRQLVLRDVDALRRIAVSARPT